MDQEVRFEDADLEEMAEQSSVQLDDTRTMSSIMDLSEWIEAASNLEQDISLGKIVTPPILKSTDKGKEKQRV